MTLYIGVDFHPHQQTVCWRDRETGEIKTRSFSHHCQQLREFYQQMPPSTVGIEAGGKAAWFEKLLFDNQHQLLIGNPAVIRKRALSKHKNDRRDARPLFELLERGEFPALWLRAAESEEIFSLLRLRHNLVRQRTQVANQLQALAHEVGLPKSKIENQLFQTALKQATGSASFAPRRQLLFALWESFSEHLRELDECLQIKAQSDEQTRLLMTQRGVGYLTALAVVHILGDVSRFDKPSKQAVSFVGLDPVDESSGSRIRFGEISKAGSPLLRFLLGQAAQSVSRDDAKLKAKYQRLCQKKDRAVAKTAIARSLLVKLVIMLRDGISAQEFDERGQQTRHNARRSAGSEITVA